MLVLTLTTAIFSQDKPLPPFKISYSNSNGDVNNPNLTDVTLGPKQKSAKQTELERKLDAARLSGNTASVRKYQEELNGLLGSSEVFQPMISSDYRVNTGGENEFDYNQTSIHPWSIYSHTMGIAPSNSSIAGRLFYFLSQDSQSGSDSVKLMYSTNNGSTWLTKFWMSMTGYAFNKDEMDMEVVYDGTNTWVFMVAGVTDQGDNRKKILFIRENITASGSFYWTILNFPGSGAGMNYYNPRITSDNANYTSNTYVMMICSMDSLAGANHTAKQKYVYSSTPFAATPGLNYGQPNGSQGFHWATSLGTISNAYVHGDIAYYKDEGGSGENRIITVYNCYNSGYNNIYIAYLNGYSSSGSSMVVNETNVNKQVRIAFNGGTNNRNGMITYVRFYNASDWDIFALKTTTGGNNSGAWVRDTIDYTGDRARTCDLTAVRNAANQFKLCYVHDNPTAPAGFYRSYNGTLWSGKISMATTSPDTVWATPRAGYLLGGGDDGAAVWSTMNGYNGYFSKLMMTTTGITGSSQIPLEYSLLQNYPNPFNPVTNIRFSVPKTGIVSLKIYDITGKEVASLVNGNMNAGSYTVDFDASHLSSGAYFYRLSADGFISVKKMMLVK